MHGSIRPDAQAQGYVRCTRQIQLVDATHLTPAHMYITDARHFLDDKGGVARSRGPAKVVAEFHGGAIAYATYFDSVGVLLPRCFKCKKDTVWAELAQDDAINWHCPHCQAEGRISNLQGTLWELSARPDAAS